ncbi:hypothetical protein F0U59_07755 [Archangium gephyra]|nr:hypothetical protein F0U59_07755 [Archangium gephyra]
MSHWRTLCLTLALLWLGCAPRLTVTGPPGPVAPCPVTPAAPAPEEMARPLIQAHHVQRIQVLAFSPSGRFLASGSSDGTARVWDLSQKTLVQLIRGEWLSSGVNGLAWGATDRELSILGTTGEWRQVDFSAPNDTVPFEDPASSNHPYFTGIASHGFGAIQWAGVQTSFPRSLLLYGPDQGLRRVPVPEAVAQSPLALDMAPDGSGLVLSTWRSSVLAVWEPTHLKREPRLISTESPITRFRALPGRRIATLGDDDIFRLLDGSDGRLLRAIQPAELAAEVEGFPRQFIARDLAVSRDSSVLALLDRDGVGFWELSTGRSGWFWPMPKEHDSEGSALAFSPDGKQVAFGTESGRLYLVSVERQGVAMELASSIRVPQTAEFIEGGLVVAYPEHLVKWSLRTGKLESLAYIQGLVGATPRPEGGFALARVVYSPRCGAGSTILHEQTLAVLTSSVPLALPPTCPVLPAGAPNKPPFLDSSPCSFCDQDVFFKASSLRTYSLQALPRGEVLFAKHGQMLKRRLGSPDTLHFERPEGFGVMAQPVLSEDGRRVAAFMGRRDSTEAGGLWDAATGRSLWTGELGQTWAGQSGVVALSPNGERAAVAARSLLLLKGAAGPVDIGATITALALPAQGPEVIIGTASGDLLILREGQTVKAVGTGNAITHIKLERSGPHAVTFSNDGSLQVWDLRKPALLATLVLFEDDEWLSVAPNGVFFSSLEGADRMAWQFTGSLEAMRLSQYPALRSEALMAQYLSTGKAPAPALRRAPTVSLSGEPTASGMRLKARVSSAHTVASLLAFVEGRPAASVPVCRAETELEFELPLPGGPSQISVLAVGEDNVTSALTSLRVEREAREEDRPDLWLVGVGIGRYPLLGPEEQLRVASDDARDLVAVLSRQAGPGAMFRQAHTTVLTNSQATRGTIRQAISRLESMKPEDLAVILLSAHGSVLSDGRLVLLTSSAGASDASKLAQGVLWEDLASRISRLPGRVLVLMDACHAGASAPSLQLSHGSIARRLLQSRQSGVLVAAASKGRQRSREDAWNGLFTGSLLMALSRPESDLDGNGWLEFSELFEIASRRVVKESGGKQTPWLSRQEFFGELRLARTPAQ